MQQFVCISLPFYNKFNITIIPHLSSTTIWKTLNATFTENTSFLFVKKSMTNVVAHMYSFDFTH